MANIAWDHNVCRLGNRHLPDRQKMDGSRRNADTRTNINTN